MRATTPGQKYLAGQIICAAEPAAQKLPRLHTWQRYDDVRPVTLENVPVKSHKSVKVHLYIDIHFIPRNKITPSAHFPEHVALLRPGSAPNRPAAQGVGIEDCMGQNELYDPLIKKKKRHINGLKYNIPFKHIPYSTNTFHGTNTSGWARITWNNQHILNFQYSKNIQSMIWYCINCVIPDEHIPVHNAVDKPISDP